MDSTCNSLNEEVLKGTILIIAETNKYIWFQMNCKLVLETMMHTHIIDKVQIWDKSNNAYAQIDKSSKLN